MRKYVDSFRLRLSLHQSVVHRDCTRTRDDSINVYSKRNYIDNAPIESFFGHMKDELDYKSCVSIEELRLEIARYMAYYNYERKTVD